MTKDIFKHYKPLHEQIRIHRQCHSGTWKIISNALGKKKHAQEQLDILQSALKLQILVEEMVKNPCLVNTRNILLSMIKESKE